MTEKKQIIKTSIKARSSKKIKTFFCVAIICIMAVSAVVIAKFVYKTDTTASINETKIGIYHIDIAGADRDKPLSEQMLLKNMNPGETRSVDFYIDNGGIQDSEEVISDVSMDYEINLIHTNNIPLEYRIYDKENHEIPLMKTILNESPYENTGTVLSYTRGADGEKMVLKIKADGTMASDKYTLKIFWNNEEEADYKYVKEIDYLYISIVAYEHNPLSD